MAPRIMPCLLLQDGSLVKTVKFKNPGYIGDPINAIKIYNEKEVDELILLDIAASVEKRKPNIFMIRQIAAECFMPLAYGGGITTLNEIKEILKIGVEKVSLNTAAIENPNLVKEASDAFGSQAIVVSIDVKKNPWGNYEVYGCRGTRSIHKHPLHFAGKMEELGAGELLITSIDKEGTWEGYDIELLKQVSSSVAIPIIANGGAGKIDDFAEAIKRGGASAAATGSMVVYQKKNLGVLINFPGRLELERILS